MITSYKQLRFFILADRMMNTGKFRLSIAKRMMVLLGFNPIFHYLNILRHLEYYDYKSKNSGTIGNRFFSLMRSIQKLRLNRMGPKLGFSIDPNVLDYGVSLPHWGTIVIGSGNRIGKYAVFHTSTCVPMGVKRIGDYLYVSTGAKITKKDIVLGDNITIAANSVCTRDCPTNNVLLVGAPASVVSEQKRWTD